MIPSTIFVLAAIFSSLAVGNGAIIQRQGTVTFMTPQPTSLSGAGSSTTPTTSIVTASTTPTTTPTTSLTSTTTSPTTIPTTSLTPTTSPTTSPTTIPTTSLTPTTSPTSSPASSLSPTSTGTPLPPSCPPVTPTTTSATPTGTAGGANCNGIQQWQAAFAYVTGNQVIFNGQLYTAKQWTYNNAPPSHPDQWVSGGACAQPINNKANCSGVGAWQSNVAYTAGNKVTFQNHLYSAVQWTEANAPGDASGTWKDLGVCA